LPARKGAHVIYTMSANCLHITGLLQKALWCIVFSIQF
jgi:hypothetical protein